MAVYHPVNAFKHPVMGKIWFNMPVSRSAQHFKYITILGAISVSIIIFHFCVFPNLQGNKNDFEAYRSAYQAFIQGENPYDDTTLKLIQQLRYSDIDTPILVFNPPLFFPLFSPILAFDFSVAAHLLFVMNIVALFLTIWLLRKSEHAEHVAILPLLASVVIFVPVLVCLFFNQVSIILTLCIAAALYYMGREQDFVAGLCAVPLLIKPHIAYLLIVALVALIIRKKRWSIMYGFVIGMTVLSLVAELLHPKIHTMWLFREHLPTYYVIGSGVPSMIRAYIQESSGEVVNWPYLVIPLVLTACVFFYSLRNVEFQHPKRFLALIPLSLLSAPYGFIFDQSALVLTQVFLMIEVSARSNARLLATLAFLISLNVFVYLAYQVRFWGVPLSFNILPVVFLVLWTALSKLVLPVGLGAGHEQPSDTSASE
jgi:hypothetical protein